MMQLWNSAVRNVGGLRNTLDNYRRIVEEFFRLAKAAGVAEADARAYAQDIGESTAAYMEVSP